MKHESCILQFTFIDEVHPVKVRLVCFRICILTTKVSGMLWAFWVTGRFCMFDSAVVLKKWNHLIEVLINEWLPHFILFRKHWRMVRLIQWLQLHQHHHCCPHHHLHQQHQQRQPHQQQEVIFSHYFFFLHSEIIDSFHFMNFRLYSLS